MSEAADIRPLTLKDEENIIKLFANPSIYNQTSFTGKDILNDFADYSGIEYTMDFYYIGVFIDDLLVGISLLSGAEDILCRLYKDQDELNTHLYDMRLSDVFILPSYRGMGLGSALIKNVIAFVSDIYRAGVLVEVKSVWQRQFWEAFGFNSTHQEGVMFCKSK